MDKYERFKESIGIAVEKFKELDKRNPIRLVSHLDADGISACSILIKMLNSNNRKYSISIVQHLNQDVLKELSKESYKYFIFADLGSGQLKGIKEHLGNKTIFIFDHHKPEETKVKSNIIHVNPHLFGIDGGKEVSGAGVSFLFARQLNKKIEDMAHVAVIGAMGDMQSEKDGFLRLNKGILDMAVKNKKIKVIKGLRIFGAQTKPLHKVLEYSTDPYIPGVSGSESGAIQFLNQVGVDPKLDNGWKKVVHLTEEELKKLVAGIIMQRLGEEDPEDVLGDVYILNDEKKESALRDAKEFATLLNACGRLGKSSLGIGACLGDKKTKERAIQNLNGYKKEIVNAMKWYEKNKESEDVIVDDKYIIINAKDRIMPTMIGTVASIISKSNGIKEGTFIMSLAYLIDGTMKASLRLGGYKKKDIDLREVIKSITDKVGGEAGGHKMAAGAIVPMEKEKEFIDKAKEVLGKKAIEEVVG
jgi:RecJ-like exonuclease